jgi:CheY-like chemotaxis protein
MKKILIVDDDRIEREILQHLLDEKYETAFADNGSHALEEYHRFIPDLVLMDVEMPEMNGFEACQKMRQQGYSVPIVFLSFLTDKEDKIKAYNAGCDDFIGKPYDLHEMLAKLEVNLARYEKEKEFIQNQNQMMEMANRSMTDLSYMGRVIQSLESFHSCQTYEELALKVFALLQELGLCASIVIFNTDGETVYIRGCENKPLESNLLDSLKGQKRILEFGHQRCAFNWQNTTVLVRNMPEDEVLNGQMKDYLGYLMNGFDSAIHALQLHSQLQSAIENFKEQNRHLKLSIMQVIEDFETSLDELFQRPDVLGTLPLDVEDKVIKIAEKSREKADSHFSKGLKIEEQLDSVLLMFAKKDQGGTDEDDVEDEAITLF